jgi:hypothetical protein
VDDEEGDDSDEYEELPVACEALPPIEPDASGSPASVERSAPADEAAAAGAPGPAPGSEDETAPDTSDGPGDESADARRSGIPSLSAASWSHSGGLNRNDV